MITLYTKPIPLNQKFFVVRGRNILSKKYRDAKLALETEITSQWHSEPLTGNLKATINQFYGDKRRRDIDSWLKILLDSMSEIVYVDDVQITELLVTKDYDKNNPRVEISVIPITQ